MKASKKSLTSNDVDSELVKQLTEENEFLSKIVDAIPPGMYFDGEIGEQLKLEKHSTLDKLKLGLKRKNSNAELSNKGKHKRAKLGPFSQKTVTKIFEDLSQSKEQIKSVPNPKRRSKPNPQSRATTYEELKKKLAERINILQKKRNLKGLSATDASEKKKLTRQMKKIKNKAKGNKVKLSVPRAEKENGEKKVMVKSPAKPVYNKEGKILYSKFDFAEGPADGSAKGSKPGGKNVKNLFVNAEKTKEKIEKLKNTDSEKAEKLIEKEKWKNAIQKSEGMKVKDDLTLLKRSVKKQEKKKQKSKKEWKERGETVEKRQKFRQEKRTKNIKANKQRKLDKKIKAAKKKGRVIPG